MDNGWLTYRRIAEPTYKYNTTRIKKKDALLNDHFNHFFFDFKLNVLHYWKAQFLSFENQKEKVLNLEAFGRNKKRVKIVKNRFHNSIREKEFSVSLSWAITFKPFEIQTWDWSRMKENSKIFKITLTEKWLKVFLKSSHKKKKQ